MICQPTDVELETIINRINNGDINLQPNFQRGEVWSNSKKVKLVDSILRNWKIPPIHVILGKDNIDEVLDGQQRLATIRDFFDDKIKVDGSIQPYDENISELDGMTYSDLPVEKKRQLRQFSITIIRLSNYKPEEPAELFYRLNQPATLTAAEQRNAYIGTTRNQIKELVNEFENMGAEKGIVGFSNSRLAYDEIISKYAYMIEINTLKRKVTAGDISKKYRDDLPYSDETINIVRRALEKYILCMNNLRSKHSYCPKYSKATLISWLIYLTENKRNIDEIENIMFRFESTRDYLKGKITEKNSLSDDCSKFADMLIKKYTFTEAMLNIYNQRASMGSTDALSVIYRDIILNVFSEIIDDNNGKLITETVKYYEDSHNMYSVLESINNSFMWGDKII